MPANLSPDYHKADELYKQAATSAEKVSALEKMLATIPKHKGTEKMQADIRRRIKKLKEEAQKKGGPQRSFTSHVEKEGAGQIALVGPPNTGKSTLLAALTHALPEIADFPFTTRKPLPGMMPYRNIQIQLVDLPPITAEFAESWAINIIRVADASVFLADLGSEDTLEQIDTVLRRLEQGKVRLVRSLPEGYEMGEQALKKAILVGNKADLGEAPENLQILAELFRDRFPVLSISCTRSTGLAELKDAIYSLLGIIRVYTKMPGREADRDRPFVMPLGATVMDAAERVHKDFARNLKYARIWGSERYSGQMVQRDYVLCDEDVIEYHI